MKTAKRVLAILMAMLMAVSAFAVAASAATSIASQLASGSSASISQNTRESIVITKDATIDLGGKILKSVPGSPAITVKNGATVTIQNGYIESYAKDYSVERDGIEKLVKDVVSKAPAAIQASGAGTKVILKDVRVMGGLVRIPSTTEWTVPVASAVKIYSGAEVELDGAVLIGSFGVSNDPVGLGRADGKVTINEAIVIGYLDYVKRVYNGVFYDEETVEMVNAADRITGFLNSNVHVEDYEMDLIDKALDDRIYIFTKKPVDDQAIVTLDKNSGWATITASTVNYLEREIGVPKSTDCSYRYVPVNAYDVETGKKYALDTQYPVAELEGKEIRINYRLQFELKGDMKKLANNFDYYYNKYYNLAIKKADSVYRTALAEYDEVVAKIVDLYKQIDEAGQQTAMVDGEPVIVDGEPLNIANALGDDFYFILRSLLPLGGVTMYKGATGLDFTTKRFTDILYNYGEAEAPEYVAGTAHTQEVWIEDESYDAGGYFGEETYYDVKELGTLDKIQALVDGFKALKGDSSLGVQSKWTSYAHYVLDNYEAIIGDGTAANPGLIKEAYDKFVALKAQLTDPETDIGAAISRLGMSGKLGELDKIINALDQAKKAVDEALANEVVSEIKTKIDNHANDGTVEKYMSKLISAINNYRQYFTPENFVTEDGNFGLAYMVDGPTEVKVIEKGLLNVSVIGGGVVNYTSDVFASTLDTFDWTTVPYTNAVTLTAVADAGNEFMYYVDSYTQRILSTNPTFVVDTKIERYVEAVFESTAASQVVFTNHSGVLYDVLPFDGTVSAANVDKPEFTGYDLLGWGPKGATSLATADFTSAYQKGNSAFEDGASYNINGFAFPLNKTTSSKYLATPKYKAVQKFDITFVDGDNTWSKTVLVGDSVTYTASGDGFKYWQNDKGQIVSVYRKYSVQAVQATTLTAVYDGTPNELGYVNIVAAIEEEIRIRVYAERSIPAGYKVVSNGILLSYTADCPVPTVADINNDTVKAIYSTKTTNQGVLTAGMLRTSIARNGVGYARAFVEIKTATGSQYIYSDVFDTNG